MKGNLFNDSNLISPIDFEYYSGTKHVQKVPKGIGEAGYELIPGIKDADTVSFSVFSNIHMNGNYRICTEQGDKFNIIIKNLQGQSPCRVSAIVLPRQLV